MTKAEQFHKNFQARLKHLDEKEKDGTINVSQTYELHILKLLDGEYDDEADMQNMGLAIENLQHLFIPYIPSYAANT